MEIKRAIGGLDPKQDIADADALLVGQSGGADRLGDGLAWSCAHRFPLGKGCPQTLEGIVAIAVVGALREHGEDEGIEGILALLPERLAKGGFESRRDQSGASPRLEGGDPLRSGFGESALQMGSGGPGYRLAEGAREGLAGEGGGQTGRIGAEVPTPAGELPARIKADGALMVEDQPHQLIGRFGLPAADAGALRGVGCERRQNHSCAKVVKERRRCRCGRALASRPE